MKALGLIAICAAVGVAHAQIPPDFSGAVEIDVDISKTPGRDNYLASFSVRDATTGKLFATPAVAFEAKLPASLTMGEGPIRGGTACMSESSPAHGWCINLLVAADADRMTAACEAIVTLNREVRSRHRFRSRLGGQE
jgi:hypothetical protein